MGVRCFEIAVAGPFRLDLTAWALRRRAHNAVDRFDGTTYRRTVMAADLPVEVAVRHKQGSAKAALAVELRSAGAALGDPIVTEVGRFLERTLGLGVELGGFYRLAERDTRLTALARRFVGLRPPRFPSVFEAVVNAVACQQLSLVVGIHLLNRLAQRYGPTASARDGAPSGFPTPERLAEADPRDLRGLGFSTSKARTVTLVADQVARGDLDLEALEDADGDRALATLLGLGGIGRWSAEYTLLRGLGRLDVLPGDDVGARNNLRRRFGLDPSSGYDDVAELSRDWSPYGGLVYFHLLLDALDGAGQLSLPAAPDEAPSRVRAGGLKRERTE